MSLIKIKQNECLLFSPVFRRNAIYNASNDDEVGIHYLIYLT